MPEKWVSLGSLCHRQGFMNVNRFTLDYLEAGFELEVSPPQIEQPHPSIFRENCLRWQDDQAVRQIVDWAVRAKLVQVKPVWKNLTVADLQVDLSRFPQPVVRLNPESQLVSNWRWKFYPQAFCWFWSLLFHETNCYLAHPEVIWHHVQTHGAIFSRRELREPGRAGRNKAFQQYFLAVYERVLGIQWDIEHQADHYLRNIVSRQGLDPADSRERMKLFRETVHYLRGRLEESFHLP